MTPALEDDTPVEPVDFPTGKQRPSFQYYPGKARNDEALVLCSVHARLCWRELIDYMHFCTPYGHLAVNGRALTVEEIQCAIGRGFTRGRIRKVLAELEDKGVLSRTEDGVIFCRRMVRDEDSRNVRAAAGKAGAADGWKGAHRGVDGGRPRKVPAKANPLKLVETVPPDDAGGGFSEPPPVSVSTTASSSNTNARALLVEESENANAGAEPPTPPVRTEQQVRAIALECAAVMIEAGQIDVDPDHPLLSKGVREGISVAEVRAVTKLKRAKGKSANYVLTVIRERRLDALKTPHLPPLPEAVEPPSPPPVWRDKNPGKGATAERKAELARLKAETLASKVKAKPEVAPVEVE